jgi:hypothetical protein
VLLGGASVVLFVISGMLRSRQLEKSGEPAQRSLAAGQSPRTEPAIAVDDDLAEIEALLRKRGIT